MQQQGIAIYLERLAEPRSLADIALVFVIVYAVLKLLRGTRAVPMAAGLCAIGALYLVAVKQRLATLEFVLSYVPFYFGIAVVVLFQNELRAALVTFGNRLRLLLVRPATAAGAETAYDEIVLAATTLASTKTGALIVLERSVGLKNFIDSGVGLGAELTYDLLVTIFNPATPLHDGAVIVRDHRIAAAACFLPLTLNPHLSKDLGTRHRAAIGITEDTDAVAVVVSEETGLISFVEAGRIKRGLDAVALRHLLTRAFDSPSVLAGHERRASRVKADSARRSEASNSLAAPADRLDLDARQRSEVG